MDTTQIIIIAIIVIAALAVIAWLFTAHRRREHLRMRFGPEYHRTVGTSGSARKAEAVLEEREKRVSRYEIRPLTSDERARFGNEWRRVQAMFVDDPSKAVGEADALVNQVMSARGYPMADFDRRAEDLSVDHAQVVHHYRAAREIAARHGRERVSTEDLRQALVHYRALFGDLLEEAAGERRRA